MARTIEQIQAQIIEEKEADAVLAPALTSTSRVSIWRLWTYITAVCIWTLETLFDAHKAEVNAIIASQKPHTLLWYVTKAKAFQYGVSLPADTDVYAVVPPVDESVLIVTSASAIEVGALNVVRLKLAKGTVGALEPLEEAELTACRAYMQRVKDAGVRLDVTSGEADSLRVELEIYYDPLVLSATGERLDGTEAEPVKNAVNAYLSSLPFDGVFVVNDLRVALEAVEGVLIGHVVAVKANYGATPYVDVPVKYVADAGYMAIDEGFFDANIVYLPPGA